MRAGHATVWGMMLASLMAMGLLHVSARRAGAVEVPEAGSFQVMDCPNDDGSAVLVAWDQPGGEMAGAKYVVEVARRAEDFAAGRYKTRIVKAEKPNLASTKPQYFGFSEHNEHVYFAEISPGEMFGPAKAGGLTDERLEGFAAQGFLNSEELARAKGALLEKRPEKELDGQPLGDRRWLVRLGDYLRVQEAAALRAQKAAINGERFYYRLAVLDGEEKKYVSRDGTAVTLSGAATADWFRWDKWNNAGFAIFIGGIVLGFIQVARRRPNLYIRRIAGLDAVEEAIGRSTEMDSPVYFVHGIGRIDQPNTSQATMASINVLAYVARRVAQHNTRIKVMNHDAIVTAISQEVVQQAYDQAGRPDAYNRDDVSLVASDQYSYAAAVSGSATREQPGAIFFMGMFGSEALLLAESGSATGAIQIAGTDSYVQLPFFVTACDYTLIGEELYAASAYLSRDAKTLGALRGQDIGKVFLMVSVVVGGIVLSLGAWWGMHWEWIRNIFYTN